MYDQKEAIKQSLENGMTKKKLFNYVARQFVRRDMILEVDWLGSTKGVFYEPAFGTGEYAMALFLLIVCTCALAKPFPKNVPMVKSDIYTWQEA